MPSRAHNADRRIALVGKILAGIAAAALAETNALSITINTIRFYRIRAARP